MARPKVMFVVGTRPDAIKTAPVVVEFKKFDRDVDTRLVSTGQHREMLEQALGAFGLEAHHDLAVMRHGQNLGQLTARILEGLVNVMQDDSPDMVIAQGDTTTTFCASLAAFYLRIPFGHVEAGLRTETVNNPFPEEFNRRATGLITKLHFAPTGWAAHNLKREGIPSETIFVTGNTGIDAVLAMAEQKSQAWYPDVKERLVLLTTHRRENWGEPQRKIAEAAKAIVMGTPDTFLVVPMHRNPQVRETLTRCLGELPRTHLIEPPDYPDFVKLMQRSHLILTDSGGVQEEAPAFGKPILVLRDTTERPEGIEAGSAILVGANTESIVFEATRLLTDDVAYEAMARVQSPYGDGQAAARIRYLVLREFGIESPEVPTWTSSEL